MHKTRYTALVIGIASLFVIAVEASAQRQVAKPYFYDEVKVVCIGINRYRHASIGNLRKAEADAKLFGETLGKVFGYEPKYLLGKSATKTAIETTVKTFWIGS